MAPRSSTLAGWGLAMPSTLVPAVDAAGADGDSFVALLFTQGSVDVTTRTLRVVDTSAPTLPLAWLSGDSPIDVTAYTVLTGAPLFEGGVSLALDPSTLLWQANGTSSYAAVTSARLGSSPGAWLLDTAAHDPVFVGTTMPAQDPDVDPLTWTYFARAQGYGDATQDPDACTARATSWAGSVSSVAPACPAGALAQVGVDTRCEEASGRRRSRPTPSVAGAPRTTSPSRSPGWPRRACGSRVRARSCPPGSQAPIPRWRPAATCTRSGRS